MRNNLYLALECTLSKRLPKVCISVLFLGPSFVYGGRVERVGDNVFEES